MASKHAQIALPAGVARYGATITAVSVPAPVTQVLRETISLTSVITSISVPPPVVNIITQLLTATITTISIPPAVTLTQVSISIPPALIQTITATSISIPPAITLTATSLLTLNAPALLNLGGITATTTATITTTLTTPSAFSCPTDAPLQNPSFESTALSPWIQLSAGTVSSGRALGGSGLSAYAYKFSIDATNPNLPQRLIQPVLLCPNSTYTLSFKALRKTSVGTISVVGSVQAGNGALVAMAGGVVSNSLLYGGVGSIASLSLPVGTGAVPGVLVLEATFGPSGTLGAKEVFVDEVVLARTGGMTG
ncbi:hypothetical protein BKA63DRAFT_601382 [Paraphoma chrysanthemicola]|nr:hypothetical protein BKA63DRAFT_601382 [Paraphoma chrysanthemicola]